MTERVKSKIGMGAIFSYRTVLLAGVSLIGYYQKQTNDNAETILKIVEYRTGESEKQIQEIKRQQSEHEKKSEIIHNRLDDKIEKTREDWYGQFSQMIK